MQHFLFCWHFGRGCLLRWSPWLCSSGAKGPGVQNLRESLEPSSSWTQRLDMVISQKEVRMDRDQLYLSWLQATDTQTGLGKKENLLVRVTKELSLVEMLPTCLQESVLTSQPLFFCAGPVLRQILFHLKPSEPSGLYSANFSISAKRIPPPNFSVKVLEMSLSDFFVSCPP